MSEIIDVTPVSTEPEAPSNEVVNLDEATFFKLKFYNESAVNKKLQADLALEAFKSAVSEVSAKFSEGGAYMVTDLDLDKATITRTKK